MRIAAWALAGALASTVIASPGRAGADVSSAGVVAGEGAGQEAAGGEERFGASVRVRGGAARAPFHTAALSEVASEFTQARLLVVEGHGRVAPHYRVGARLPVAASTVMLPGGSYADDKALGNPELFVERAGLDLLRGRGRGALRLAVGLPFAEHGGPAGSLMENRTLALSDALDGWRNPELFGAGILPVTVSGRLEVAAAAWRVDLGVKLPLAIRLHDASLPDDARTRAIGFTPHAELGGCFRPFRWLDLRAAAFAAVQAPAAAAPAGARGGALQLGIEPQATFLLFDRLTLTADLALPLGGPLDGTLGIGLAIGYSR